MSYYYCSLKGLREQNEDKHIIKENFNNNNNYNKLNLYGVFDGHGGKEISTYLEKNLYKYFLNKSFDLNSVRVIKKNIINIYDHIEEKLDKEYRNKSYSVGSTALISLITKDKNSNFNLFVINLGDCRAVICEGTKAIQLSVDHKPNDLNEKKRIESLGGKIYYDGFDWRIKSLSLSRAFGDIDSKPYVSHRPDIFQRKLKKNDKFLILACDGLWDVLSNQEVVNFVNNNNNDKRFNICKKLGEYAIKKGSTDNITIIIKYLQ